ncbi:hypothetical protein HRI_002305900 [Hibiscus trionum]|uniref:Josephin-like protein n=1 Tax=Hibiscus trionum TaxID=183268 RepID=A0A9W7I0I2_HIBTR|nr:hypothetical protein HRI_002305900 [Hibiscus trionum]
MERKTRGSSPERMEATSNLCMPRFKGSSKSKRFSPMSLFERIREAVFRLIMLSALTKATPDRQASSAVVPRRYYRTVDAHRSEAVAECIEFIKEKAYREENRESGGCNSSMDVAMPVPVM